MANIFTGWSFDKALEKSIDRKNQVKQFDEMQKYRYKDLGERIKARKAMDEHRENMLAEQIRTTQSALTKTDLSDRGLDIKQESVDNAFDLGQDT